MIEFKNVSKIYQSGTHALKNVNIKIDDGEFVFIVGSSGAGKSTFLKLIIHEETPSTGDIIIDDISLANMKRRDVPYLRRMMGIVFQDFRLIDKMTVYENVAFAMRCVGANPSTIKKRVPYVLKLVGLGEKMKNRPSELSGGEQQRVSLARALVNNPSIIIADEPTGNIDPEMSYEILDLLSEINKHGTTVIIVTHEQELVTVFGKRIVEIRDGCVLSDTSINDKREDEMEEEDYFFSDL
ncbi:MAG: cell division ATP-binding protein FtsE [Acutalibacteraceae bacterium]